MVQSTVAKIDAGAPVLILGCLIRKSEIVHSFFLSPCFDEIPIRFSDDWAEKASSNGSSVDDAGGGSDDASESMDTDSGETPGEARATKKKKAAAVEQQQTVKKAHLNIVFIGHVGEPFKTPSTAGNENKIHSSQDIAICWGRSYPKLTLIVQITWALLKGEFCTVVFINCRKTFQTESVENYTYS